MPGVYGRDLDLNLLRVFLVVADTGSVTEAAKRLYLTQPAVSAALGRLTRAVGAPLLVRRGRSLTLTPRGQQLRDASKMHLTPLIEAALDAPAFDPRSSQRTLRLGFSDSAEAWLLPGLCQVLGREAPGMQIVAVPVQFRTIGAALGSSLDAAVTVADELPSNIRRHTLFHGGFVCLFDPRHIKRRRLTEAEYFARDHVIVSYNGDLRGVVEDATGKRRRVRCSVASFANVGAIVDGTALIATVPHVVARDIRALRPHLRVSPVPFALEGADVELLWPAASDEDDACRFVRDHIIALAATIAKAPSSRTYRVAEPGESPIRGHHPGPHFPRRTSPPRSAVGRRGNRTGEVT